MAKKKVTSTSSLRLMDDGSILERIHLDYSEAYAEKSSDNVRNLRYQNIYMALDAPEEEATEVDRIDQQDEGRFADVYMPFGAAIVDTAVSQLYQTLFSNPEYMNYFATEYEDTPYEYKTTEFMRHRHQEMQFKATIMEVLNACHCFDYVVTGCRWVLQEGYVPYQAKSRRMVQFGDLSLPYAEKTIDYKWRPDAVDRSDFFMFNFFRSFHDPRATNGFEDSRFFIDVYEESAEELKARAQSEDRPWQKFQNIDKVLKKVDELGTTITNPTSNPTWEGSLLPVGGRKVPILRYWTRDYLVHVCMDEIICRTELTGWPLTQWKIFDLHKKFRGMGVLERMERQQLDINATLNARRNYQNLVSDPWGIVHESVVQKEGGSPRVTPGKLLVYSGAKLAKDLVYIYQPAQQQMQDTITDSLMQMDISERIVGLSDNAFGQFSKGRKTASETNQVASGQSIRQFQLAEKFEGKNLIPTYMELFKLEQVNLTEAQQIRIFGESGGSNWLTVNPEDLRWMGTPQIIVTGASYARLNDMQKQQFLRLFEVALGIPQVADIKVMFTKAARMLDPKDYQQYVKDDNVPDHNVPPRMENELMAMGHQVEVSPLNNDQLHLMEHMGETHSPDFQTWPTLYKERMNQHIMLHQKQMQMKTMTQQAQAQPSMPQGQVSQMQGMRPGQGPQMPAPMPPNLAQLFGGAGGQ